MLINEYNADFDGMLESVDARISDKTAENVLNILDSYNVSDKIKFVSFGKSSVKTEQIEVTKIISYNTDRELKDIWVENKSGKQLHWFDLSPDDRAKVYKRLKECYSQQIDK